MGYLDYQLVQDFLHQQHHPHLQAIYIGDLEVVQPQPDPERGQKRSPWL